MGGDQTKMYSLDIEKIFRGELPNLQRDIDSLEREYIIPYDIQLLILDPLTGLLGGADDNSNTKMREQLAPLLSMIKRRNMACIAITHMNKDSNQTDPLLRIMGSTAMTAVPRSVLAVMPDHEDEDRHYLASVKMNLGKSPPSLAYRLDGNTVLFESDVIQKTGYELFNVERISTSELGKAMEFLKSSLTPDDKQGTEVKEEWIEAEDGSKSTLKRARAKLGIKSSKRTDKEGIAAWWWSLPDQEDQGDQHQGGINVDPLDEQPTNDPLGNDDQAA